jgi:hypothetical protein
MVARAGIEPEPAVDHSFFNNLPVGGYKNRESALMQNGSPPSGELFTAYAA